MFNNIKKKLQSNRGASMMMVLALFFVCVIVSSIIVFNASNGLSRTAQRTRQQRGYLAVSSAADFIAEEIRLDNAYVGISTTKKYGCDNCNIPIELVYGGNLVSGFRLDPEYIGTHIGDGHLMLEKNHIDRGEQKATDSDSDHTYANGIIGEMLIRAAEHVYLYETEYEESLILALADERMPDVNCKFTMDKEYNTRFVLATAESDYRLTVTSLAIIQDGKVEPKEEDRVDPHMVYYKVFNMEKGTFEEVTLEDYNIPIDVTIISRKVTWNVPKVEKGGLSD